MYHVCEKKTTRQLGPRLYGTRGANRKLLDDNICFKTHPMGEDTISNMMKTIVAGTSLKESEKSSRIVGIKGFF